MQQVDAVPLIARSWSLRCFGSQVLEPPDGRFYVPQIWILRLPAAAPTPLKSGCSAFPVTDSVSARNGFSTSSEQILLLSETDLSLRGRLLCVSPADYASPIFLVGFGCSQKQLRRLQGADACILHFRNDPLSVSDLLLSRGASVSPASGVRVFHERILRLSGVECGQIPRPPGAGLP